MMGADQNLQLAQLVSRWWNPTKHDFRIGAGQGGVKLVWFDRREGESTLGRMAALGDKLMDKRIVERNIAKGLVSKEQYEKHLADLADREGTYETVEIDPGESGDESQAE